MHKRIPGALVLALAAGCGGNPATTDTGPSDSGASGADTAVLADATGADTSSESGASICGSLGWLHGTFTCTGGSRFTCELVVPGRLGEDSCDLDCRGASGATSYFGFGYMGHIPSDITLEAPTSFVEMHPPRRCTRQ